MSVDIELCRMVKPEEEFIQNYNGDTVPNLHVVELDNYSGKVKHLMATKNVKLVRFDEQALEKRFNIPEQSCLDSVVIYHEDGKRFISFDWVWFVADEETHCVKNIEVGTMETWEEDAEVGFWYETESFLHWCHRPDIREAVKEALGGMNPFGISIPVTKDIYDVLCNVEPLVKEAYPTYEILGNNVVYQEW